MGEVAAAAVVVVDGIELVVVVEEGCGVVVELVVDDEGVDVLVVLGL